MANKDKVIIRDVKIDAIVGLYAWERVARQTLWVSIELATDIRQAAKDDNLQHTIDYSAVCDAVVGMVQQREYQLLETLAEEVTQMIRQRFSVSWVKFSVCKEDVLTHVRRVGIDIERGEN
jgi:dihydroneopterin aldolase